MNAWQNIRGLDTMSRLEHGACNGVPGPSAERVAAVLAALSAVVVAEADDVVLAQVVSGLYLYDL